MTPLARLLWLVMLALPCGQALAQTAGAGAVALANPHFALQVLPEAGGLVSLRRPGDPDKIEFIRARHALGPVVLRYLVEGQEPAREFTTAKPDGVRRTHAGAAQARLQYGPTPERPFEVEETFELADDALLWRIALRNTGEKVIQIPDLSVPLPMNTEYVWDHEETFVRRVFRHAAICGSGSFAFWLPVKGTGSHLVMTCGKDTRLEFFTDQGSDYAFGRGDFRVFFHSALAGSDKTAQWPIPRTCLTLQKGAAAHYELAFRWADSYQGVRDVLARGGSIDVRVAPGMVVPQDQEAMVALRSVRPIREFCADAPDRTRIQQVPTTLPCTSLYRVRFDRLGENKLIVVNQDHGLTILEFFVTQPVETLIRKRAAFIAANQQHRCPGKWYDGLFSLWDVRQVEGRNLLGPENLAGQHPYAVSGSDDPSNGKCLFLSEKNVAFPEPRQIAALEYFIERFVWGKHQRTDQEQPHPYGIYGCDSWHQLRNSKTGLNSGGHGQERMWRTFDYTTYFALYYNMYRIARDHPNLVKRLDAKGYLRRAAGTARAYFDVPYNILMKGWALNGWCDWAFKVGNFHEKYLLGLIDACRREGLAGEADYLQAQWEKKVKYFIYDAPWPFASEMPIDSTAYESTYAAGHYAMRAGLKPDQKLWHDKNRDVWYSHPRIEPQRHREFLARQHMANLACRGTLEPAWWALGSDFRGCGSASYTLSYMSQMGGWAVLEYALRYDDEPADNLRLGYASMLSSWALVNAGSPESNYGYFYPGPRHDGAASWGFQPRLRGTEWNPATRDLPRGPWPVDGEIDHGLAAGVEAAACVLFDDPLFGLIAYGGRARRDGATVAVQPMDGVRRQFHAVLPRRRLHLRLDRDGLAAGESVRLADDLSRIELDIENRSNPPLPHETRLHVEGLPPARYVLTFGRETRDFSAPADGQAEVALTVGTAGTKAVISVRRDGPARPPDEPPKGP